MSRHPLLRFLFSFAFSALFLPCTIGDAGPPYGYCRDSKCGDVEIHYPFGIQGDDHACGDPHFRLFCPGPLLPIGTNNYTILSPSKVGDFNNDKRITIVNSKAVGVHVCDLPAYSIGRWDPSYFKIDEAEYRITTFFSDCPASAALSLTKLNCSNYVWYYDPSDASQNSNNSGCKETLEVPIPKNLLKQPLQGDFHLLQEGFEIIWSYYDETRNRTCNGCVSSGGYCGYNISNSDFLCYCEDGPDSQKCPNANGKVPETLTDLVINLTLYVFCMYAVGNLCGIVLNYRIAGYTHISDGRVTDGSSRHTNIVIIGSSIGAALLVALLLIVYKLNHWPPKRDMQHNLAIKAANSRSVSKVEKFLEDYAYEMPTRYSYSQLKRITNNFSFKLGEGGFGVVYRGTLSNGTLVAAKVLDQSRQSETQFMNEVGTIGRIHHVHLVRLLGFCFEGSRSALLYEYMPNGSLEKFIFPGYKDTSHTLKWDRLYSIALGAARGIAYLHTDCEKRIIHLDIKPHNVLLDENLSPKVSDFGLAKLYSRGDDHISVTAARGTPGYAAPEMWSRNFGPVTDKSDVYSFGMLLLEMVGGRKNIDVRLGASNSQLYFPEWIFHHLEFGELRRLRGISSGSVEDEGRAMRMSKVGLWCIQSKPSDRPSMSRVVQMLEGDGNDVSNPPSPFDVPSTAPDAPLLSAEYSSSNEIKETG